MNNMHPGKKIVIVSGSRLRRISDDNKRLLDQLMQEGALIENDTPATVKGVVPSADGAKTAYVVEVQHEGVTLHGWVYGYECTPGGSSAR